MKARRIAGKLYTPFEVSVPKSVTGINRVRKFFPSRMDADAYIVRVKQKGFENADTRVSEPGTISVAECAAMWLARHGAGESPGESTHAHSTRNQLKMVAKSLTAKYGRVDITKITHREGELWLAGIGGGYTHRKNHYRVARRFFAWAHDWLEAIPRNPFIKVRPPTGERRPIEILTPERMEEVLTCALRLPEGERWPLVWWLCLGGFAGFRHCEASKFDPSKDISEKEVFVRNPKRTRRGLRPRFVEILPPLRRAMEILPVIEGRVVPWNEKNFRLHRDKIKGGVAWPQNCLRHSFRSYFVAEFQDIEKCRVQMGHESDEMTTYQYGTPEMRETAKAWLAIDLPALWRKVQAEAPSPAR